MPHEFEKGFKSLYALEFFKIEEINQKSQFLDSVNARVKDVIYFNTNFFNTKFFNTKKFNTFFNTNIF